jgi:CelD/BcsL family acetyltransferase involved in cellulose biosynthesis
MWVVCAVAGCAVGLTGCQPTPKEVAAAVPTFPDQSHVCEVHDWKADASAAACHRGQKVVFLPDAWGNEQLPLLFVAINCNMRYTVTLTTGGAVCIYAGPLAADRSAKPAEASSAAPAASAQRSDPT